MPLLHEIARLWAELMERKDHDFIVQEVLGRIWPKSIRNDPVMDEDYVKDIVLLMTIFDIQRTRIRYTHTEGYLPPRHYQLSVDSLLDCLDCLSRAARAAAIPSGRRTSKNVRDQFLNIVQQAFFSGFRASVLAIERLSSQRQIRAKVDRLRACAERLPADGLSPSGRDWSSRIFNGAATDLLGVQETGGRCEGHAQLDIPDRGGFALTYNLARCVPAAIFCIAQKCRYSYRSALNLLDLRLMLIAECFQHVKGTVIHRTPSNSSGDTARYSESVASSTDIKTILDQWIALGTQLQDSADPDVPESETLSTFLEYTDDIEPGPPSRDHSPADLLAWPGQVLSITILTSMLGCRASVYSSIADDLGHRSSTVFDTRGDLQELFDQLAVQIRDWMPQSAITAGQRSYNNNGPHGLAIHPVYVLNCDDLHPIGHEMLLACIDAQGQQALERDEEIFKVFFRCPFHPSPAPIVERVRRVTPISSIYRMLQTLVNPRVDSPGLYDDGGDLSSVPAALSSVSEVHEVSTQSTHSQPSPLEDRSEPTSPSFAAPSRPVSDLISPSVRPSTTSGFGAFMKNKALSFHSSKLITNLTHQRNRSSTAQPIPDMWPALSPDATNLIVWSRNRICRRLVNSDDMSWGQEHFLENIVIAATGPTHYAAASQGTGGFQLSLFDASGGPAGQAMMRLDSCPLSMNFSLDGTKLAVGTATELRIIDTTSAIWAGSYLSSLLIPPPKAKDSHLGMAERTWPDHLKRCKPHSQRSSFSPDGSQIMIGTQFDNDEGSILIWLFEIRGRSNRERRNERLSSLAWYESKIKVSASAAGLTAMPCFHDSSQTAYIICTATEHKAKHRVDGLVPQPSGKKKYAKAEPETIVGINFTMDRVSAAIALPGQSPRFVMVNEGNQAFIVRRSNSGNTWEAELIPMTFDRGSRDNNQQRLAIAALSASEVTAFYIQNGQGYIIRSSPSHPDHPNPETIPLDEFFPRPVNITSETP